MEIITTEDQAECRAVLKALNAEEVFRPIPPHPVCDGIVQLDDIWLVGTYTVGRLKLHLLIDASHDEAWAFFRQMRGENTTHINPRISFVGPSVPPPSHN